MRTFPFAFLIFFFSIFSNSRPFCSSKGPIYSSAEVERDFLPLRALFSFQWESGVFFEEGGFHERKTNLSSSAWLWRLALGWDLGFLQEPDSRSTMQSCEVVRNDVQRRRSGSERGLRWWIWLCQGCLRKVYGVWWNKCELWVRVFNTSYSPLCWLLGFSI